MNILFIIDKTEFKYFEFNNLVTNFWLIKEFLRRGHQVYITINSKLYLRNASAFSTCYQAYADNENIFYSKEKFELKVDNFELVMFRSDPPVDNDYFNASYILDFAKKTKIVNDIKTIRNFNEKLHTVLFSEYMPEYVVTASKNQIEEFLSEHNEIVLKPLDKCFGSGVMYLRKGDLNTRAIINSMTNNENSAVMVQKYIPAIKYGDKRVLTLGCEVLDECVIKLPTNDDFKFNTHNDNYIKKGVLSDTEKSDFSCVAQKLNDMGICMAGLDVVGGKIIEINITSPCYFIKEINNNFSTRIEQKICDYISDLVLSDRRCLSQKNQNESKLNVPQDFDIYEFKTKIS